MRFRRLVYILLFLFLTCFLFLSSFSNTYAQSKEEPEFVGGADSGGGTNTGTQSSAFGLFYAGPNIVISDNYAYVIMSGSAEACSQTASSTNGCELKIYDISDRANPEYVGGGDASGGTNIGTAVSSFSSITISGNHAYILKSADGTDCADANKVGCELQIWNISDPAAPAFVGGGDASGGTNNGTEGAIFSSISISGNFAYITKLAHSTDCADANKVGCELQIWNISDPAAPAFVGGGDVSGGTNTGTASSDFYGITISGSFAYITKSGHATDCGNANKEGCELQIWNISDPAAPVFVGGGDASGGTNTGTVSNTFYSISVSGNYAYIGKNANSTDCADANKVGCELQIWNISDPAAPAFVGGGDVSGGTNTGTASSAIFGLVISGDYAYIGKNASSTDCGDANKIGCELQIWNISDPAAPAFVGGGDASGGTNTGTASSAIFGLVISGDYVYIAKSGSTTDCSGSNKIGCELQVWQIGGAIAPTPTPGGGGNNSSFQSSSIGSPGCSDSKPTGTPNLFQVDTSNTQATLYFAPASNSNKYFIAYGNGESTSMYGVEFDSGVSNGVLSYTINYLSPNTFYSFVVRGGNGCMPGDWGSTMTVKTGNSSLSGTSFYKSFASRILSIFPRQVTNAGTGSNVLVATTSKACQDYIVKSGDNLWNIATQNLGSGSKYIEIMQKNSLGTTLLNIGQTLKVGC